jgi:hypothetical protein
MVCYQCNEEAVGICKFCGRAVCRDCHSEMPVILSVYVGANQTPKTIVVADALWCGKCQPQPEPIAMPEIY